MPAGGEPVTVEWLTAEAFAPFGTVMMLDGAERRLINEGTTERFHALATTDVEAEGGRTILSVFRGRARAFPYAVTMMERHPLGSQAFWPLSGRRWLVVVAPDEEGAPGAPRAFLASAEQGVQVARGVWHHPLMALDETSDFLVADREGLGDNLVERTYDVPYVIDKPTP
ncbi:ureidoglycolate lyase [Pararhizobium mangrovi]|uniref:Ureidoglycolate lyase n=1 Tax=Pararhizobium mangrovi TaxID=2590452 RepID=A0A506U113_9HYPH|nr:ureidoglycolate lyase [Pararhizobium mangrovi]